MDQNLLEILNDRKTGLLLRHPKSGAIANAIGVYAPVVDTAAVSAKFTISTPTEDRAADVVEPSGFQLGNYKNNPLVLYDHGFGGITLPIGKSQTPDGKLTVKVKQNSVEGECFFAQSSWEAMQIFQLVDEGVLNCASVHIDPLEASVRIGSDGRRGLHITKCDLLEWSIVGIPCNPEATRKVLDRGKLADRKIAKPLEKMLKAYAAKPKGLVQGMSLDTATVEDVTKALPPKEKPEDEEKPEGEAPEEGMEDEPTDEAPEAEQDGGDAETPETPPEATGETPPQQSSQPVDASQKPGAQLLSGISQAVGQFTQQIQGQIAAQENQTVVDYVTGMVDQLTAMASECQEAYRSAYGGDMAQGQAPQPGMEQEEDPLMKSLSLIGTKRLSAKGLTVRLKRLAEENPAIASDLDYVQRVLGRILENTEAKAAPQPEPEHDFSETMKTLDGLTAQLAELRKQTAALKLGK